jgi:hypothetical protein
MFARKNWWTLAALGGFLFSFSGCGPKSEVTQEELAARPELQPDRQLESARASLKSSQKLQRAGAMGLLQQLGPKAAPALPDLEPLLNDPDPAIAEAARKTIAVIKGEEKPATP